MGSMAPFQNLNLFVTLTVVLICSESIVFSYKTIDPNGCTVMLKNTSAANGVKGVQKKDMDTVEKCINYCVDLVVLPACVAVEFDNSNSSMFGCWYHRNQADLVELFDAGPNIVNYNLTRNCTGVNTAILLNGSSTVHGNGMPMNMSTEDHTRMITDGSGGMVTSDEDQGSGSGTESTMIMKPMMSSSAHAGVVVTENSMTTYNDGDEGSGSGAMETTVMMNMMASTIRGEGGNGEKTTDEESSGSGAMETAPVMMMMTTMPEEGGSGEGESTVEGPEEGSGTMETVAPPHITTTTPRNAVTTQSHRDTATGRAPTTIGNYGHLTISIVLLSTLLVLIQRF